MNHPANHPRKNWENPDVTAVNRALSHSAWGVYENVEQALAGDRTVSKWILNLDGQWKFRLLDSPDAVEPFWDDDFNHSDWSDIQVPGNWETQEFGEPIYTNTLFPWNHFTQAPHIMRPKQSDDRSDVRGLPNPPHLPPENPTGCYFRTFEVPEGWSDRRVFLHFGGVETAFSLWVNGQSVGYSEDSKLPSAFDITAHIRTGINTVALQVMRFATGTYLEDQDYWYLSGIFRSVSLQAKPRIHLEDWKIDALSDRHHPDGTLSADIRVTRENGFADHRARLSLYGMDNILLAEAEADFQIRAGYRMTEQPTDSTARFSLKQRDISAWTPETPVLYMVVMTLLGPDGEVVDIESCRVGFKRVEIQDGIVLLNGRRLLVRGVNRHEHEPRNGRTVSREHMIAEIRQMKRLGINAVRTCHYPDDPAWYDLCDEWGLLVICECNLETHGVLGALTHNPAWGTNFLERAIRMVLTHKNHACVYAWSLGNESGTGANHAAMAGWIREFDNTRLCQYEAGEPGKSISDIRGNMYATQEHILRMLADPKDTRPIILVEYLYQIRNAGGGMHHFNELMEQYPRFQGGYIWDWQDKCLMAKTADGEEFFGYGGDFNESIVDWECPTYMTNNGTVLPDLTPKPVAEEVKQAYCPIQLVPIRQTNPWRLETEPGRFLVRNRALTRSSAGFRAVYALRENGHVVETGDFPLPVLQAGEQAETCFRQTAPCLPGAVYHVDITITEAAKTPYAEEGYVLGCFQFPLASGAPAEAAAAPATASTATAVGPLACASCKDDTDAGNESCGASVPDGGTRLLMQAKDDHLFVTGDNMEWVFSTKTGLLVSVFRHGHPVLLSGPVPCFTRPPSGIDAMEGWGRRSIWKKFDQDSMTTSLLHFEAFPLGTDRVRVETMLSMQPGEAVPPIRVNLVQTVHADGSLFLDAVHHIDASLGDLPRIGMEMQVAEGFEDLSYFGMGPGENYRDRLLSARLGVFTGMVTAEHFPFIPPSETGGHEQTRWLCLTRADGATLRVDAAVPFHFDARHSSIGEYRQAAHDHELERHPETWLHVDAAHAGIGSDMGWSTFLTDGDQVKAAPMLQSFHLHFS